MGAATPGVGGALADVPIGFPDRRGSAMDNAAFAGVTSPDLRGMMLRSAATMGAVYVNAFEARGLAARRRRIVAVTPIVVAGARYLAPRAVVIVAATRDISADVGMAALIGALVAVEILAVAEILVMVVMFVVAVMLGATMKSVIAVIRVVVVIGIEPEGPGIVPGIPVVAPSVPIVVVFIGTRRQYRGGNRQGGQSPRETTDRRPLVRSLRRHRTPLDLWLPRQQYPFL